MAQVVCCAAARTTLTAELTRVEQQGIANLCKALQVGGLCGWLCWD